MRTSEANVEIVSKLLAAVTQGNLEVAVSAFEDDAKWRCAESLPEAGTHEGKAGLQKLFGAVRKRYRNEPHYLHLTVNATDDHVFAEYSRSGSSDPYAPGSEHAITVFHVVMGKIREAREFVFRRS
ncbi:MAG: nuclear transport factor 2 family protein [Sandaracinaceae bacterium]|nr:nuclear transport factor 2 family protein [Sandaracinaceae bacterium]